MNRPTIADIAGKLGISTAAVSYALNGRPGVSSETRQRVLDLVEEMDWRPNTNAKSLRSRRSMAVGMALSRDPEEVANEPFYSYVQAGIEQAMAPRGYSLMISRPGGRHRSELDVYRSWAAERRVDGVILFDIFVDDPRVGLLTELGLPFVEVTSNNGATAAPRVLVDDATDARTLVDHLAEQGYRALIHLSGPDDLIHETLRAEAVTRAAARLGITVSHRRGRYTMEEGTRGFIAAMAQVSRRPVGVIGSSDLLALGAAAGARDLGLAVPEEVGVASWDESLPCRISNPPLTSLTRNPLVMGQLAAGLLLDRLDGFPGDLVEMEPSRITVRASSRRLASA